jgi:hypothetical protein
LLILVAFLLSSSSAKEKPKEEKPEPSPTAYNPYPFGILPPDLDSELMRVQREIRGSKMRPWYKRKPYHRSLLRLTPRLFISTDIKQ